MLLQLAGCYSGDSAGGIVNIELQESIVNSVKEVAVTGKISLSWTAPVAREDEVPISMAARVLIQKDLF